MLRIRLQRKGRKKRPVYHVVVADSRSPRDGRIVEDLGQFYNLSTQNQLKLNEERAIHWIKNGAQPSDTVRSILKKQGILYKMHLQRWGKSDEEIEAALQEWREARQAKAEKEPTKKEQRRAMLEAEEKEFQKQLQKKAEEAAKEKAKQEALASEEEQQEEEAKAETTGEAEVAEETAETEAKEEAAETEEEVAEQTAEASAEEDVTEATVEEQTEDQAEEPEAKVVTVDEAEAGKEVKAEEEEIQEAKTDVSEEEKSEAKAEEAESKTAQKSTDMLAKEAIEHIENTPLDKLKGFVTEDEDRVTVQRAWESKQEEG